MILDIAAQKESVPRPQILQNLKYLKMVSSFLWESQRRNESRFALLLFMTSFLLYDSIFSKLWMIKPSFFCVKMNFNFFVVAAKYTKNCLNVVLQGSLLYNEYIVYDVEQIRMRYVIQVEFNYGR